MTATRIWPIGVLLVMLMLPGLEGANSTAADRSITQFLARSDTPHAYRATRRLEARNGSRSGWLEAVTEYAPRTGFRYRITGEGGAETIRHKVLHAVLEGEREMVARGETARAALDRENYTFTANGLERDGLVSVSVSARRKERALVNGTIFLLPDTGDLVRLEGRLAKSPSFWVKRVDIVREYQRIGNVVVPVALESTAQVRFLGAGTLRMTYDYLEIDGYPVRPAGDAAGAE